MLKFISREINSERNIVAPILNDVIRSYGDNVQCNPTSAKILRQNYNPDWEKKYSWLLYQDGRMFCKLCTAAKKDNVFAKTGAGKCNSVVYLYC